MNMQQLAHTRQPHSAEVGQVYERVLAGSSMRSRHVEVGGGGVHLLEKGAGPPVVLLHGTRDPAGFLLPLLNELQGVHAIACDRPGVGLSDPIDLPRDHYRERAVEWLDRLLDTLELDTTTLVGHSGGGVWALWYALAHPDRVKRLVLLGVPTLPKTRCPSGWSVPPGWASYWHGWRHPAPSRYCGWPAPWARRGPSPATRTWSTCW
jgi:pimeloyl-ACP methyl ester carboxylesterase